MIAIDLKRFPSQPHIKRTMENIGFTDVHYHVVQHDEHTPTDEYLERVGKKYVSTLTLLGKEAFPRGFKIFRLRVLSKYGAQVLRHSGFDFVYGRK